MLLRRTAFSAFLAAVLVFTGSAYAATAAATPTNVVISQLYGAGGNSGATYNADYLELFNPTGNSITLSGYSLQYASATGTTISVVTPLAASFTLAPGEHYLVAAPAGSNGTALPTPDFIGSNIGFAATAGKVYLVSSTTKLSAACGTGTAAPADPSIVDFISYGTTANCYYGSGPAPAPSTTKADIRNNACVINGDNSTEYTAAAANPRNSSSSPTPCAGSGPLAATGAATPSTVNTGSSVLLTVSVSPATNPPSTGISVTADLSALSPSSSSSQQFYDDGTNGDVTPNDNTFSYATTVTNAGSFTLPVNVADSQMRKVSTSISLTASAPPQSVSIRMIQSAKPSNYLGQKVTTSGIVVGVKSGGFYLEAKDADTNPTTPEGILVYTKSYPPTVVLGAEIQVSGTVGSYPGATVSPTPDTEIDSPTSFTVLSTNNALPAPVVITSANDSPSGGIYQFTRYEGMRVAIDSFTTTSGTDANLNEATETNTSNGQFYGVVTGVARPYREPGISVTDVAYTQPIPNTIPRFDSNPELLLIDSLSFGGPAINLTSSTTLTGVSGVMDFSTGAPEIILDAAVRPVVTGGLGIPTLPVQAANEYTIASFNMERFYTSDSAAAKNPGSSVVVVTPEAYQRRLKKVSLAIRNVLNSPDIIGAQEIQDLQVLTDVANQVSADAKAANQPDPGYTPYLYLATDPSGINTGFLVKNTVTVQRVDQYGLNTTFTNANGGQSTLNDRTPLVLHAGIKRQGGPDYPITVIDVHQRSLINVDDPTSTGQTVRLKREAQAEYLANLIQSFQANGEHVVTIGDYNSFQFSDGFVDTIGVTKGNPVPADQVVQAPTANLASPNLVDLVTLLPADQQQSYVESGSAQVLDHVVVTQDLVPYEDRLLYAHIDSDFPLVDLNDANLTLRISDHDPAVVYFALPAIQGTVKLVASSFINKLSDGSYQVSITMTNSGTGTAQNVQLTGATLGSATGSPLPQTFGDIAPNGGTATLTVTFPASAGTPGATVVERVYGTYANGGTFTTSTRAKLPQQPTS